MLSEEDDEIEIKESVDDEDLELTGEDLIDEKYLEDRDTEEEIDSRFIIEDSEEDEDEEDFDDNYFEDDDLI